MAGKGAHDHREVVIKYQIRIIHIWYQPSGAGALIHPLRRRTACNTSLLALSKMTNGVWKEVKSVVIGPSDQLSIIPSVRSSKIQNGRQGVP